MTAISQSGDAAARAQKRIESGSEGSTLVAAGGQSEATLAMFHPVQQAIFLKSLAERPIVGRAARAAGVDVSRCYKMRKRSRAFAQLWDEALIAGVDTLEECAIDRALDKSDKLLELLLKGHRPETFRDKLDLAVASRVDFVVDLVPFVAPLEPGDVDEDV